jgi:hypothetical protein
MGAEVDIFCTGGGIKMDGVGVITLLGENGLEIGEFC